MKKIILMVFAAGLFAFTSCSSDDDGGKKNCEELIQNYLDAIDENLENPSEENQEAEDDAEQALNESDCQDIN